MYQVAVIFLGSYLIWIEIILALVYIFNKTKDLNRDLLKLIAALFLNYLFTRIFGIFYPHSQPYVENGFDPIIQHGPDNAFPSDHASVSATVAAFVYSKNRNWGKGLFILSLLISLGRVLGGVHYPIDVVFGLLSGIMAVFFVNAIIKN